MNKRLHMILVSGLLLPMVNSSEAMFARTMRRFATRVASSFTPRMKLCTNVLSKQVVRKIGKSGALVAGVVTIGLCAPGDRELCYCALQETRELEIKNAEEKKMAEYKEKMKFFEAFAALEKGEVNFSLGELDAALGLEELTPETLERFPKIWCRYSENNNFVNKPLFSYLKELRMGNGPWELRKASVYRIADDGTCRLLGTLGKLSQNPNSLTYRMMHTDIVDGKYECRFIKSEADTIISPSPYVLVVGTIEKKRVDDVLERVRLHMQGIERAIKAYEEKES